MKILIQIIPAVLICFCLKAVKPDYPDYQKQKPLNENTIDLTKGLNSKDTALVYFVIEKTKNCTQKKLKNFPTKNEEVKKEQRSLKKSYCIGAGIICLTGIVASTYIFDIKKIFKN